MTLDFLKPLVFARTDMKSLEEYLRAFDITGCIMQTEENLRRVADEVIEDASK